MAELVATKLAETIVTETILRISELLVNDDAVSLTNVRHDIESFHTELTRIKCFLEDADRKQDHDKRVKNWLFEVRDIAREIEETIEIYLYEVNSSLIKTLHLRKLRKKIGFIKDKLRSVRESRETYQIEFSSNDGLTCSLRNLRRSYCDDMDDVKGIVLDETERGLKGELMKDEDRRSVVSVVGMGGLGKTTLAKKVFNDGDIRRHFDCSAWVFVSQQYSPREILSEVLVQVGFRSRDEKRSFEKGKFWGEILEERRDRREFLRGLEDHELVLLVKNELREKRYLIVLDDIWSIEAWFSVQSAFPKGKRGSKVMFTTRVKEVAVSADPYSSPIEPPLLTGSESWELLRRKVFHVESFEEGDSRLEFEQLGKEMAEKCAGLPLAIVVLGGLLRTKRSLDEWKHVRKIVKSRFVGKLKAEQRYGVEDILELSFLDLPYYLRPCFLYLGIFPEDYEIPKRELIRVWVAEGFVSNFGGSETFVEDVAERYLEELVDRCMVQVGERNHARNGVKTCRLHDLMRDFCISKSKEELFFESVATPEEGDIVSKNRSPRVAIRGDKGLVASWKEQEHARLRSLHISGINARTFSSQKKNKFVLLRVLKLDFIWGKFVFNDIPFGIGNLIHLRYLRVSGSSKKFNLPHSLGNLKNLLTLDIRNNRFVLLPSTISSLINLRHLLLPYKYSRSCFGNFTLTNIQTLKGIYARDLIKSTLKNIRVLQIKLKCHQEFNNVMSLLSSQFIKLRSFSVLLSKYECEPPNLKPLSQCQSLTRLRVSWPLTPQALSLLPKTISKLELHDLVLNMEVSSVLEKLPCLRILRMDGSVSSPYDFEFFLHLHEDRKIVFSADGYQKLETLSLKWIYTLKQWEVEKNSMPNLKRLDIESMNSLAMLPIGLKYITGLKELNIRGMKKAFGDRIRVGGEDFYKVCHVQAISISDSSE